MSRIVSPYPPYLGDVEPSDGASWWRFQLVPNDDHKLCVMTTDGDLTSGRVPTWCSWEFFDGDDRVIDTGFDRPTKARFEGGDMVAYIDVLSEGPPTSSTEWIQLTSPGEFTHPEDEDDE